MDFGTITKNHVICDAHFADDMVTVSINKQLSADAIPSIIKFEAESEPMAEGIFGLGEDADADEIIEEYSNDELEPVTNVHLEIKRIEPDKCFPCDICKKIFPTREARNGHIDDHFKVHKCRTCGKSFDGIRKFDHHRRDQTCQRIKSDADLVTYECFICHQSDFFSLRSFRIHYNRHHKTEVTKEYGSKKNNQINRCKICNKTFANVYIMKSHVTEVHIHANSFSCDVCGKKFNRSANLQWHRLIHEDKLPCICKICGKSFRTVSGLNLHKRTHTGAKPYKCDICNEKAYAYNTDLKRHKRSAHGIIDKTFPCTICEQIFYEPKFLKKHMGKAHPGQ